MASKTQKFNGINLILSIINKYIKMKKYFKFLVIFITFINFTAHAQTNFEFKLNSNVATTSVKNQASSGTCWSYSTLSFVESEMLRLGKPEVDLSEMYVVRMSYIDKAKLYVKMHGTVNFSGGGALQDAINVMDNYGLVPQEVYAGLNYGTTLNDHSELDAVLKAYVDVVIKSEKPTIAWIDGFIALLDSYLGKCPEIFTYKGKEYTPRTFADNVVGLKSSDYMYFSSYTHHNFYEQFIMEVPDNWSWGKVINLPVNEMISVMKNAINNNYSVAWASDVSEKGFSNANAVALVPSKDLSYFSRDEVKNHLVQPVEELEITQEMRQLAFENYETTDDHGMHIIGLATDKSQNEYFYVKNSWGESAGIKGYFYASDNFVAYKTMSFMVHKNAVPSEILKKINRN